MSTKLKKKHFLTFFLIVEAILIIDVRCVPSVEGDPLEYFPLGMGTYWTYQTTDKNGNWITQRTIDDWEFIGLQFTVYFNEFHDGVWQNRMWISKTSDSLIWWGFEDQYSKFIASNGLTYVKEPVQVGTVEGGTTTGTLTLKQDSSKINNVNFQGIYTIDAIETITVPAGTFENCIKIHEQEITPDGKADFYVWYAPNIGPVKYQYPLRNNRIDVLTEYKISDDDPFDSWLLPKVPIMVISTIIVASIIIIIIVIRRRSKE